MKVQEKVKHSFEMSFDVGGNVLHLFLTKNNLVFKTGDCRAVALRVFFDDQLDQSILSLNCMFHIVQESSDENSSHGGVLTQAFCSSRTYLYNFDPLKPHFYIVKLLHPTFI